MQAQNYINALARSNDVHLFEFGEGTIGGGDRLFAMQWGTRRNASHGMFSEVSHFTTFEFCLHSPGTLLVYPAGTRSLERGLVGSKVLVGGGTWSVPRGHHIAWGSFYLSNPCRFIGTFRWAGAGW